MGRCAGTGLGTTDLLLGLCLFEGTLPLRLQQLEGLGLLLLVLLALRASFRAALALSWVAVAFCTACSAR